MTEAPKPREEYIKYMVDRFLGWKLPEDFHPDGGIIFKRFFNEHLAVPTKSEPSGTNLFDYNQATAMIRYMLEGMPTDDSAYLAEKSRAEKAEADYLKMRDGHEHVVHKMHGELAAEKEAREKLQAALEQVTEMNLETIKDVETLVAGIDKLKAELKLAQETNHYDCIGVIAKLKAERQALVDALKPLLDWAYKNHGMPNYSEILANAREALKKVNEL